MNERRSLVGGVAGPSLLLVLIGLYAFWVQDRELDSARPQHVSQVPPPVSRTGIHAIHSRIWEDPLAVTFGHVTQQTQPPSPDTNSPTAVLKSTIEVEGYDTIVLPVLVPGSPYAEDKEQRMRTRYAVTSALSEAGYALSYPTRLSYMVLDKVKVEATPGHDRAVEFVIPVKLYRKDTLLKKVDESDSKNAYQVLVLWINETQLGKQPLAALENIIQQTTGFPVPTEERTKDDTKPFHVRVIGPASSDTLIQIANEAQKKQLRMRIYSPRATIGAQQHQNTQTHDDIAKFETKHKETPELPQRFIRVVGYDADLVKALKRELQLRAAWPTDSSAKHGRELVLITESDTSYGRDIVNHFRQSLDDDTKDTQNNSHQHHAADQSHSHTDEERHFHVIKYLRGIDGQTDRQLTTPARSSTQTNEYRLESDALTRQQVDVNQLHRPAGHSQFDYLLRLRNTVKEIENHAGHNVNAIGIVGTDMYDKLLILRALRSEFPRAVFFTTDLDAQLWHPTEYASTRNVIVASHFDLTLKTDDDDPTLPPLQETTPPFRDSYQTSTFLAVRLAVEDERLTEHGVETNTLWGPNGVFKPRVFEIGRHGPFEFSQSAIQPNTADRDIDKWISRLALLSLSILIGVIASTIRSIPANVALVASRCASSLRPLLTWIADSSFGKRIVEVSTTRLKLDEAILRVVVNWRKNVPGVVQMALRSPVFWTAMLITTLSLIVTLLVLWLSDYVSRNGNATEPFNFIFAVSMWPTIFLRWAAILVALSYLVPRLLRKDSTEDLDIFKEKHDQDEIKLLLERHPDEGKPPLAWIPKIPKWRWILISGVITFLICIIAHGIYNASHHTDFTSHFIRGGTIRWIAEWTHLVAITLAILVTVSVIVRFEDCRRAISAIANHLEIDEPLLPYKAIGYIGLRTRILSRDIGWVVTIVVLLSIPYHPRMDYSPMFTLSLAAGVLAGGSLLIWSYLIRKRAHSARQTAIRELNREKRFVELPHDDQGQVVPTDDDPWSKAVKLSKQRRSTAIATAPEVSSVVATKNECDLIDDEIELIKQIDEGAYAAWYSAPGIAWLSGSAGVWAVLDMLLRASQSGF